MEGKQTKGRRKIEMKTIEKNDDKLITFSKRKGGIYKKGCELSATCDVEVGMVIFSPTSKPYSFATSSMENVINKFFNRNLPQNNNSNIIQSLRQVRINELNERYNDLYNQVQEAKSKLKFLKQTLKRNNGEGWWSADIEELDLKESHERRSSSKVMFKELSDHISERTQGTLSSSLPSISSDVGNQKAPN